MSASSFIAGMARPKRKPWASPQPSSTRRRRCGSVSTPSATASRFIASHIMITASVIERASARTASPLTKERSIFTASSGIWCTWLIDE